MKKLTIQEAHEVSGGESSVIQWTQSPWQLKAIEDAIKGATSIAAASGRINNPSFEEEKARIKKRLQNEQLQEWFYYILILQSF